MVIDDFIMLGKTVPELHLSDGREWVCTAGYSLELKRALRVYPMSRFDAPKTWEMCRIPLERNPQDSRDESWKIQGDRSPEAHHKINQVITNRRKLDENKKRIVVESLERTSLKVANSQRISLCVLCPIEPPRLYFKSGKEEDETAPTPDLFNFERGRTVKQRFKHHPRLKFRDKDGYKHDLMLRDWGCYELMRKHGDTVVTPDYMSGAIHLDKCPPLFCGNQTRHRTSWLVIAVFSSRILSVPMQLCLPGL